MKKLWLGIVGLAAASTANAAVVTYTLSLHEAANGTVTANPQFAVYATVSPGDNSGLFAFGLDMKGSGDPGGPTTLTLTNRSPNGVWDADPLDPNYDSSLVYPTKKAGYGTGRGASGTTGIVSGVTDLAAIPDLIPVFGIGQQANLAMNASKPPPDTSSGLPVAYGNYVPNAGTDQVLGNPANPAGALLIIPAGSVRIATGSWTGSILPFIEQGSSNTKVSVWKLSHPTGTENEIGQLQFAFRDLAPVVTATAGLGPTATNPIQAVGGSIAVTGANNQYVSEVDQLLDPSVAKGSAPIVGIGDETTGGIYVMAKLTGTPADIQALLGTLTTDVDATDSQFALLHANYDAAFGGGGFNALFRFTNIAGAKVFNWDFGSAPVTVDQLAAVPEPATIGLMAFGALGLLARRRRNA